MSWESYVSQRKRRSEIDKNVKMRSQYIDEELNSVVNICVDESDHFLSPYSDRKNLAISEELAGYLKNATNAIPVKNRLHLRFKYKKVDETNKNNFAKSIKHYYSNQLFEVNRMLNKNLWTMFLTIFFASIFLAGWVVVEHFKLPPVVRMIIQIIAWAFVGQTVELLFVKRSNLRHAKNKILQLLDAKITFDLVKTKKENYEN